jgi:predicted nucleic acid-binding protein
VRSVLDTSAAVIIALKKPGWELLQNFLEESDWVETPDLLIPETANAVWKHHKFGRLGLEACELVLESSMGMPDEFVPTRELCKEAFALAAKAGRPAYDMFFLVLARRNLSTLVSADKQLLDFSAKHDVRTFTA